MNEPRQRHRAFTDSVLVPAAESFDLTGRIPENILKLLAQEGYWGSVISRASGGTGAGMTDFAVLHEEVGRGCSSVRSLLTVHSMVLFALARWGSPAARDRWFAPMVDGDLRGAFCLSEAAAGSDVSLIATVAERTADGYLLNGTKKWTTGGQIADLLLVFARGERGISAFLVDADRPGVERVPVDGMLGTRGSMLAEIRFRDCRIDPDALIGAQGMGPAVVAGVLDIGRLSVAAGSVGIIQACLDASVTHASNRVQGGAPLREHQLVQRMIARMSVDAQAARLLCLEAARLKEAGDPRTIAATCTAKYFAATGAMRAAEDAVQIHGAQGCAEGAAVGRFFRDAKVMEIIEGSTQIQELLIAQDAVLNRGVPAGTGRP